MEEVEEGRSEDGDELSQRGWGWKGMNRALMDSREVVFGVDAYMGLIYG